MRIRKREKLAANLNHCQYHGDDMTVHKRWDNGCSRVRFSPQCLEYDEWKWGEYGGPIRFCEYRGGSEK